MRPHDNPYTPNAGARPPALVGRDRELVAFEVLLDRLRKGHTEQSMLITGLRGVGKTVLLGDFERRARERSWVTAEAEITKNVEFGSRMAHLVRRALFQVAPRGRWRDRGRRAARVLKSFHLTVSSDGSIAAGLDVEALEGLADSGSLSDDLTDLLVALGEAAQEAESGVVFLLDEVQFLTASEFEALIAALHKAVQRGLPITLVGAGLPQLPRLAGEAKSYAERLFTFPRIGQLPDAEAARALVEPAEGLGVAYESAAVDAIVEYTEGYPYFLQEYGKIVWDLTDEPPVTGEEVDDARDAVEAKLDASFFRVRAERTTELELQYLRAMAELGSEPQQAKDVAKLLNRTSEQLGPTRSRLIDKGLLYTPGHGLAAFTVPQFDRYMRRAHELRVTPPQRRARRRS
ncbi:MAG TPA: ATP-binding protein [Thermoleophilaceae bacterium]|nr:ATP-binding protein [Thermoleophilaceae bacterium]